MERLEAQLEELEILYRYIPVGLCVVDRDLRYVKTNQIYAEVVGREIHEVVGHTMHDVVAEPAREQATSIARRVIDTGEPVLDVEIRSRFRGNLAEERIWLVSVHPVHSGDCVTGSLAVMFDVTARKQLEEKTERLWQRQRLESLGVLAGGIAHDFNNLLHAILGFTELAQTPLDPSAPSHADLEQVKRSVTHGTELCNQLLNYSGTGGYIFEPVDFDSIVEGVTQMIQLAVSKNATMRIDLAGELPAVNADASQLRQVVLNLVANASDACEGKSGIITVSTRHLHCDRAYLSGCHPAGENHPTGRYVSLEVSDTGCGMPPEMFARIFDPFFTTKFTGRGLGLAAVLGIVRAQRGAVKVTSEPGRGTSIEMLLPALDSSAPIRSESRAWVADWRGSGPVLLVDDEPEVRAVGERMLELLGFTPLVASNGKTALELYRKHGDRIVCVLLDLTMPHMDGEETLRRLRQIRPTVKVAIVSGYSENIAQRFEGKGLAAVLKKPYRLESLASTLRGIVEGGSPSATLGRRSTE